MPVPPGVSTPPRFGAGAAWPVLHEAAWSAMTHLADQAPMHLWLVTRTVGADQVMVAGAGDWIGSVSSEGPIGWLAPLCSWMRHDAAVDFPAVDDPRCRVVDGRAAYARVGLSLTGRAGELLGTVWGFSAGADDPPLTPVLTSLPLVQVMLSAVLVAEQALRTASGPGLPDPASR